MELSGATKMTSQTILERGIDPAFGSELSDSDRELLSNVESALELGRALHAWWEHADAAEQYENRFTLTRTFNQADTSFGFFGHAGIQDRSVPVMGTVEEMLYDQPKHSDREKLRDEFREFVLHYFLRVTDFREPEACVGHQPSNVPEWLRELSWCFDSGSISTGFGYSQHFYKERNTGVIGRFSDAQRFSVVDLRELISKYEWIVLKVRIFDFDLKFTPFGRTRPQIVVPLREESYIVLSSDFLVNETNPSPKIAGCYGFGYAFIKRSSKGILAYGPGLFDAAFKRITFRVLHSGQTRVHMVFVANRPTHILNLPFLDWTVQLADLASLGMVSRFLTPSQEEGKRPQTSGNSFDPLLASITLANLFSGGRAAQDLCISKEQLEKDMLVQHFRQHYQMLLGSLFTWRQIPDWRDTEKLPAWVVTGTNS
jgi:hypothetical protein